MTATDWTLKGAAVTLNAIRAHGPCDKGWKELLRYLGKRKSDDEPLLLTTILDSNGLDDALWCLRALPAEYDAAVRLLVCDIVEPALAYVPDGENRPRYAVETARRFARGDATQAELADARNAVRAGAEDAAIHAAIYAARAAAEAAVGPAVAIHAAAAAAEAAAIYGAGDAGWAASWAAAKGVQKRIFRAAITQEMSP